MEKTTPPALPVNPGTCATCDASRVMRQEGAMLSGRVCAFNPPSVTMAMLPTGHAKLLALFPPVDDGTSCAKYTPAPSVALAAN